MIMYKKPLTPEEQKEDLDELKEAVEKRRKKGKWQETIESRHIQADDIDARD